MNSNPNYTMNGGLQSSRDDKNKNARHEAKDTNSEKEEIMKEVIPEEEEIKEWVRLFRHIRGFERDYSGRRTGYSVSLAEKNRT